MKKKIQDGWHKIYGYEVYVEDERVWRGIKYNWNGSPLTSYPYRRMDCNTWNNESGMSFWSFVSGVRRGTVGMF